MVAVLVIQVLLAAKVAVIVPLPVPEEVTGHQVWLLVAVHAQFEVTVKLVVPAEDVTT
jgi:hypothetical protein